MATATLFLERELIRLSELLNRLDPRPHLECRVPGCVHTTHEGHGPAPMAA